jgi:hypothetical protein
VSDEKKNVVRVLVGSTWYEIKPGTYRSTNAKGFEFIDGVSGRRVSGPAESMVAVESDGDE